MTLHLSQQTIQLDSTKVKKWKRRIEQAQKDLLKAKSTLMVEFEENRRLPNWTGLA